ncbi:MAG: hypothetical protein CMJ78_03200 [Planctomycetaceae bacterium]|nr:hypothetical protein [Planctomycetaceae bacterium]
MNFALLGNDSTFIPLVQAIATHGEHKLTIAVNADALMGEISQCSPSTRFSDKWDDFVSNKNTDAVIVAGHDEGTLTIAKQAAAAGRMLLLYPRMHREIAVYYELALIHDDTGVLLFPWFQDRFDSRVRKAKELLSSGSIGEVVRFQFDEELSGDEGLYLNGGQIDDALMQDVDLIRYLGGEYNQVTSVRSGETEDGISLQNVSLAGGEVAEATIQVKVATSTPKRALTIVGQQGTIELNLSGDESAVTVTEGEDVSRPTIPTNDPLPDVLDRFQQAAQGNIVAPNWADAIRAYEIVEATARSLRRRRTIDLHFESTSERSLFKTQMTAVGCGLLLLTLLMMLGLLGLGTFLDPSDSVESKAAAAGFIVRTEEFVDEQSRDSIQFTEKVDQIAIRMQKVNASVLIEQSSSDETDRSRREKLIQQLGDRGVQDAEQRVLVAEIRGDAARTIMRIARVAWMLPLIVFLLLQILIVITKPATPANQ